jgi:membrane-bound acyltransferase YfiQ involved in biofilm formation
MAEETDHQRASRELLELLNEIRVALPGVQVLFAFLLAVPFQQRFQQVTQFERDTYFVTLSLALVSTALLIAPSALHRINFRVGDKSTIVVVSNWLTIAGIAVLALAMTGVMLLIGDALFGKTTAVVAAAAAGAIFLFFWAGLPLWERRQARAGRRALD